MTAADDQNVTIRSYRVCFDVERRLHKLDQWRLPLPYGLPLRGLAYGVTLLAAAFVLSQLPITGALLGTLHPSIRYLAIPVGGAYLLLRWKVDGRTPHATATAWLRMQTEPRRLAAFRRGSALGPVTLGPITLAPDDRGARMRKGVVHGPGRLVLRYPVQTEVKSGALHISPGESDAPLWRGKQVNLRKGQRVIIQ